ncbi:MAG: hypothetical protein JNL18_16975 [Planctomycetaceae bacterium]|nr:hypothetical protein [Planctomycetaceae bacterium]
MVRVLSVLPGGSAVASTDRLFRVVVGERREVVEEFLDVQQTAAAVALLRRSGQLAEAIPSSAIAVEEWTDAERANYEDESLQVLAILPRCVVVSSADKFRVVDQPTGEVYHDLCSPDMADSMARHQYTNRDGSVTQLVAQSYDSLVDPAARPLTIAAGGVETEPVAVPD